MDLLLHNHMEAIRSALRVDGIVMEVTKTGPGDALLLSLTQPDPDGKMWDRQEMLTKVRALLPVIEPPPEVRATPHHNLILERSDEDGRVLLRQLNGQYRTVEVVPGRGEFEFFLWVHGEQRWFHLESLTGEVVHRVTMEKVFISTLRRDVGEEWVRGVLGGDV